MRSLPRPLIILILAASLAISFRVALEAATFGAKFHWPPGWYAPKGSGYAAVPPSPGSAGDPPSVRVWGSLQQQASLINGLHRPVRITFRYQAPKGGGWFGVAGDSGSFTELRLQAPADLPVPQHPDSNGVYRVPLPRTDAWKSIRLRVVELTDLPRMTLYIGGPAHGGNVRFADARMTYDDAPQETLLENGRFVARWPLWMFFPEWVTPGGADNWAPARALALVSLLSCLLLVFGFRRRGAASYGARPHAFPHNGLHNAVTRRQAAPSSGRKSMDKRSFSPRLPQLTWPTVFTWAAWLGLSSLLIMASGELTELGQVWLGGDPSPQRLGAVTDFIWLLQIGLFFFLGAVGFRLIGRIARFSTPLIPLLAALAMSPGVDVFMPNGATRPLINFAQFTEGLGPFWILIGIIAAWSGVLWASAQEKGRS